MYKQAFYVEQNAQNYLYLLLKNRLDKPTVLVYNKKHKHNI